MPNLNQHLLGHTFARQGWTFSQQDIFVHELEETTADIQVTAVLDADISVTPDLEAQAVTSPCRTDDCCLEG